MKIQNKLRASVILVISVIIIGVIASVISMNIVGGTNEELVIKNQNNTVELKSNDLKTDQAKINAAFGDVNLDYYDYYGGRYLDDKNSLVILIKDTPDSNDKISLLKAAKGSYGLNFEPADYSYAELSQMMSDIMNYKLNHEGESLADDIISCALNDKENNIEVDIFGLTDEKVNSFKENIADSNALVLVNTDNIPIIE